MDLPRRRPYGLGMGDEMIKPVVSAAVEAVRIAKDNPDAQQAGRDFAASVATVARLVKNSLLPLVGVNYLVGRAEAYFRDRFGAEITAKTSSIPEDALVAPKPSVAGPALQGLIFSFDEDSLREMYTTLLASAMDGRSPSLAHPAFAEIIRQLDAAEAGALKVVIGLNPGAVWPILQVRYIPVDESADTTFRIGAGHILPLTNKDDDESESSREPIPAWVDNWIRLGLVEVSYERALSGNSAYDWVETDIHYLRAAADAPDGQVASPGYGVLTTTRFGRAFGIAVGIIES
jgi:hypothetical protein